MKNTLILTSLAVAAIASSCQVDSKESAPAVPGLNIAYLDSAVHPADDFYQFVNGGWLNSVEMPADRSRWGSFDELRKATSDKMLTALTEAMESGQYEKSSDQGKAATFYEVAMDTVYLDELGLAPLTPEIEKIDKITNMDQLKAYLVNAAGYQNGYFFSFGVIPDLNNSDYNALIMSSANYGLPEREYYLKDDAQNLDIQDKYKKHVARMFGFLGVAEDEAIAKAEAIFDLEKQMAAAELTKEEKRNPLLMNNPRSLEELNKLAPVMDWKAYFEGVGADVDTVIIADLNYIKALPEIMKEKNLAVMKDYLKWTMLNESAAYLTTELDRANFDFYGKVLQGAPAMRARWERALDQANSVIGEALGQLYTDKYFPPEAKETAEEMVDNILAAFEDRIKNLEWMSDSTKEKALKKLSGFTVKIGYPDKWKDYGDLEIKGKEEGGSYLGNMISISEWSWKKDLEKIGKPVDETEWLMAPQVVNAYYHPLHNEIVFPAAILQPPFYNYQADPAVNYGGIGAVIGHEISHGFDDQGSRFDADGNLKNWWTDEDRARFEERAEKLVAQFDAYEPLEGVKVNGSFTLGENIGDLGGVNVALDGLRRHISQHGDPGPIDGFTQEQRFFISWATIWRTKYRDEALKTQIMTDPHSPGMYRAIGPLVNVEAFYEAFGIGENSSLYKPAEERVIIW